MPPCTAGCPVNTDVAGYLDAITAGDYKSAFKIISDKNPFPSVCAWVCPHPCEEGCRRGGVDYPLSIRALKRFAVEQATGIAVKAGRAGNPDPAVPQDKWQAGEDPRENENIFLPAGDVVVVGAGPSGLAAAQELACRGFSVVVLDRQPQPGGHFFASIPLYRLPRQAIKQDVQRIEGQGVKIICGVEVGREFSVEDLRHRYRAVIIATGLPQSRNLDLPGLDNPSVLLALPFLQGVNQGCPANIGSRVVVVGGGNVAMDVARTAIRLGAEEVEVVCLESGKEIPAHSWEVEEALEEGVAIREGLGPAEAVTEGGRLAGLRVKKVLSVFDSLGRFCPTFDHREMKTLDTDTIILALGQRADLKFIEGSSIPLDKRGNLLVEPKTMATQARGVFACGEVASGPGAAISAVASGQRAAKAVERFLKEGSFIVPGKSFPVIGPIPAETALRVVKRNRLQVPVVAARERRRSLFPFEKGYDETLSRQESARCMRCGLGATVIAGKCSACLTCVRLCPFGVPEVERRAVISPEKCQGCGICATACPAGAIEMTVPPWSEPWTGRRTAGDISTQDNALEEFPLIIYLCRYVTGKYLSPGIKLLKERPAGVRLRVLPCADSVGQGRVLEDLEMGAPGVALVACGGGECLADGYNCRGLGFAEALRYAGEIGIDTRRLIFMRAGEERSIEDQLSTFFNAVKGLGPLFAG